MFCSQCGHSNPDGAAFCMSCGNPLTQAPNTAAQPTVSPQYNPAPPLGAEYAAQPNAGGYYAPVPPYPMPDANVKKKSRTGLIVGLIVGVFLIAATVIALFVWPGFLVQSAAVSGYYVSEERGEALQFKDNGTMRIYAADTNYKGEYQLNGAQAMGVIVVDDEKYEFAITEDGIYVDTIGSFEKADDDFDVEDFIKDISGDIDEEAEAETPMPSEEAVEVVPSEVPAESIDAGSASDLVGLWYETTGYGGTIEFFTDGTYEMTVMGIVFGGTFEYDAASDSWLLNILDSGETYTLTMSGDSINVNSMQYTRDYVEQVDWDMENYS